MSDMPPLDSNNSEFGPKPPPGPPPSLSSVERTCDLASDIVMLTALKTQQTRAWLDAIYKAIWENTFTQDEHRFSRYCQLMDEMKVVHGQLDGMRLEMDALKSILNDLYDRLLPVALAELQTPTPNSSSNPTSPEEGNSGK